MARRAGIHAAINATTISRAVTATIVGPSIGFTPKTRPANLPPPPGRRGVFRAVQFPIASPGLTAQPPDFEIISFRQAGRGGKRRVPWDPGDQKQPPRFGKRKGAQQYAVHDCKYRSVGSNAHCERKNGYGRKIPDCGAAYEPRDERSWMRNVHVPSWPDLDVRARRSHVQLVAPPAFMSRKRGATTGIGKGNVRTRTAVSADAPVGPCPFSAAQLRAV